MTHIEGLLAQRRRVWGTLVVGGEALVDCGSFVDSAGGGGLVVLVEGAEKRRNRGGGDLIKDRLLDFGLSC